MNTPVAQLLSLNAQVVNQDFAYTDESIRSHIDIVLADGASAVYVYWNDRYFRVTPEETIELDMTDLSPEAMWAIDTFC